MQLSRKNIEIKNAYKNAFFVLTFKYGNDKLNLFWGGSLVMVDVLSNRDMLINDVELGTKHASFRDGIFDIKTYLFKKDECYYLLLFPYSTLFLEDTFCVKLKDREELLRCFEELTCNLGIMLIEEKGKLVCKSNLDDRVNFNNEDYCLVSFNDLFMKKGDERIPLFSGDNLIIKLKSMINSIFGDDRNSFIPAYIYNSIYMKMFGKYCLEERDLSILKYYKQDGYTFLNSFLSSGELKVMFSSSKINRDFIDSLYRLYDFFDLFPVLEEDIVVFRGTSGDEALNTNHNSFISTSLDLTVAASFSSSILYQILLPRGTHCIPMDSIDVLSCLYGETEAEILLRPSNFKIISSCSEEDYEVIKVVCCEKDDFGDIVVGALNNRKDELIGMGLCSKDDFEDVLEYADEKRNMMNNRAEWSKCLKYEK